MSGSEHLSDDYIAQLLAKDAKTSNAKYSAYGLQQFLPQRSTSNAPKTNTRFLKNIIRETNSHNAALQAKELEESRARFRNLHDSNGRVSSSRNSDGGLQIENHHRSKRRRTDGEDEKKGHLRRGHEGRLAERSRDEDRRSNASYYRHRDDRNNSEDNEKEQDHERRRRHHHRSHGRRSDVKAYENDGQSTRNRKRSRSRRRSRSRSPQSVKKHHRRRRRSRRSARSSSCTDSELNGHHGPVLRTNEDPKLYSPSANGDANGDANGEKRAMSPGSDSDPLDAIIGPPPPPPAPKVQARGRGNFAASSAMDSHFSSNYDPSVDVHLDPEMEDDWDQALEAIRDRKRWQKLGAERLKSAGFTEEEVTKWETGGEKREEDVKWRGRGEGREWDRGKVVVGDAVETRPEWGRLKGT